MTTILRRFAMFTALLFAAAPALAVDYCVSTPAQLRTALGNAAASAADDTVMLVRGDYPLADGLFLSPIEGDLLVRGGYSAGCPFFGRSLDPASTRVRASELQGYSLSMYADGELELDGLALEDLQAVNLYSVGNSVASSTGTIRVRRCRFTGNRRALSVFSAHKDVRVDNSVFIGNDDYALKITHPAGAQAAITVDVVFNTMIGNPRGVWIEGGGPFSGTPRVQNNILRSTLTGIEPYALKTDAAQIAATNNVWGPVVTANGGGFSANTLNVDADPMLDAGLVPLAGSPALNSGTDFIAGGVPASDHDGGPRSIGSRPDRGALESAISDISVITVTSTANSGPGTLRQAILDTNQTSNAETILFNLGAAAGCPFLVTLDTLLPAVTAPLTIDGFSQPGSSPNTQFRSYDGVHCVVLRGNLAQGLRLQPAANQAITVRGLGFQQFSVTALEVMGAGRAVIEGNSFGTPLGFASGNFAGDAIALVGSHSSLVGGTDPESFNLIANADGAGVRLAGCTECTVRNNFIGVRADGYSERGNGVGVLGVGGNGAITHNVIGHSTTQGVRVEGAPVFYIVSNNHIGLSKAEIAGVPQPIPNATNGLRLVAGNNHYVASNRIAHNGTDGLVVLEAVGNVHLKSNRIHDNGQLGIDLSPDGVDPQNSDLVDGGGNGGQNFPVLLEASGTSFSGTVRGHLPSITGNYEIELFASLTCDDSNHGEGARTVGSGTVSITATAGNGGPAEAIVPFEIFVSSAVGPNLGLLDRYITATATRLAPVAGGATSEFSACLQYVAGPDIFADGFE